MYQRDIYSFETHGSEHTGQVVSPAGIAGKVPARQRPRLGVAVSIVRQNQQRPNDPGLPSRDTVRNHGR